MAGKELLTGHSNTWKSAEITMYTGIQSTTRNRQKKKTKK